MMCICGSSLNLHEKGELRFFSYRNANRCTTGYLIDAGRLALELH